MLKILMSALRGLKVITSLKDGLTALNSPSRPPQSQTPTGESSEPITPNPSDAPARAIALIRPPLRGADDWGSGAFEAPRGDHKHRGVDIACYKGSQIMAVCAGEVTKVHYPYSQAHPTKKHYRYVQVTNAAGLDWRYFYIDPRVKVGDYVYQGDYLGVAQGMPDAYPRITDHIHFEIKSGEEYLNPHDYVDFV